MPTVVAVFCFSVVIFVGGIGGMVQLAFAFDTDSGLVNWHRSLAVNTMIVCVVVALASLYIVIVSGIGSVAYGLQCLSPTVGVIGSDVLMLVAIGAATVFLVQRLNRAEQKRKRENKNSISRPAV